MTQRRRRASRGSGEQLREEIIIATKKLLAESGRADDVSIRAVADAVGVTSPSIYLHFADKNDLLGAVVADVFRELDDAMLAGAAEAQTPMARLFAYGLSYVQFAVSHPEQYRIAAMDPCPTPNVEVDEVLRSSAFEHFRATVVECIEAGIFAGGEELPITFDLWAAAHGVASLVIAKSYLPWGSVEDFARRVLCAAAAGHVVATLIDEPLTPETMTEWITVQRKAQRRRVAR
ncbi:MAG TPA: TetR/AcrR family transcriptional regulator [Jatrophihabitantaceae bacterium]|jgi:AcrR family transcriptional regulator|nr:TetR/AcrR family transcriptional regulator [Jatrophihabitantaceae bacterium]